MGFAGKYHYGRDICRELEECWSDEDQYASFKKGFSQLMPLMIAFFFLSCLAFDMQNEGAKGIMNLFSFFNIQASQAFFYTVF
jgi:hypothetical protein